MVEEERKKYEDEITGYYLGLWNIVIKSGTPVGIMMDAAINNMLTVLDRYMSAEDKIKTLETVIATIKAEHAAGSDKMQ